MLLFEGLIISVDTFDLLNYTFRSFHKSYRLSSVWALNLENLTFDLSVLEMIDLTFFVYMALDGSNGLTCLTMDILPQNIIIIMMY